MKKPKGVMFDMDETLAQSKQPMTLAMGELLRDLLEEVPVAITSGQRFDIYLLKNTLPQLPEGSRLERLHALPNCAAAHYRYENEAWVPVYEHLVSPEDAQLIREHIEAAIEETGLIDLSIPPYGERIEHRGSSVALSALGQLAPLAEKVAWDPERIKRPVLREAIAKRLPQYDVKTGGATTFDITVPGIDKAYGVRRFSEHLEIPISDMLYIGDALFPGGNDEVVIATGIPTRKTSGPEETAQIIRELLA